jgi:tetratricopeptide (TPR) repeat protein
MERATCNCISKLFENGTEDRSSFNTCFFKSLGKDTLLVNNECRRLYGDTTAGASYKFGKEFFQRNSVRLVYTCDTYFKMMDTIRYAEINSLKKDTLRAMIATMDVMDSTRWDNNFFATRGMFHFALADYAKAEKDLDASLALDSNTVQGIYFKAWLLEIKGDYDGAKKLYSDLASLTKTNEFNIFAAIADRKKKSRS